MRPTKLFEVQSKTTTVYHPDRLGAILRSISIQATSSENALKKFKKMFKVDGEITHEYAQHRTYTRW